MVRDCLIFSENLPGIRFSECDWIQAEWNVITYAKTSSRSIPSSGISVFQPRYQSGPFREYGIWLRNNTIYNTLYGITFAINNSVTGIPQTSYERSSMIENNFIFDLIEANDQSTDRFAIGLESVRNVRVRNNTVVRDFGFVGDPVVSIRESDRIYVYK